MSVRDDSEFRDREAPLFPLGRQPQIYKLITLSRRFRGFLKRKIRDWMAPMERFIFWAISRGFIPEVTSLRSISSSVSVQ
jgi:hypothetical protein